MISNNARLALVEDWDRSSRRNRFLVVFLSHLDSPHQFINCFHLPALGDGAEGGGSHFDFAMAGEAEVDEPLAVEGSGHFFQNLDAPLIILDQFVVSR